MRLFFSILSIIYIAGIFLLADSPVVSDLAPFNPYSLLHIPLYGILTIFLIFSFLPLKLKDNVPNATPVTQLPNDLMTKSYNTINSINQNLGLLLAGLISFGVAIADEIHQAYIPSRDASTIDIFLDLIGITLVLFLFQLYKKRNYHIELLALNLFYLMNQ